MDEDTVFGLSQVEVGELRFAAESGVEFDDSKRALVVRLLNGIDAEAAEAEAAAKKKKKANKAAAKKKAAAEKAEKKAAAEKAEAEATEKQAATEKRKIFGKK